MMGSYEKSHLFLPFLANQTSDQAKPKRPTNHQNRIIWVLYYYVRKNENNIIYFLIFFLWAFSCCGGRYKEMGVVVPTWGGMGSVCRASKR